MTGWRQFILRAQMTLDRLAWGLCSVMARMGAAPVPVQIIINLVPG